MITEIIWLFSWPLFIFICYQIVRFAVKKYEKLDEKTSPQ